MIREVRNIVSNPGNPIHVIYGSKVEKDGKIKLSPIGKENTDDYIQSFKDSTDMAFILAKLAQGDTSVLNRNSPIFGDFTKAPRTFAEALQLQIDSDAAFDRLPAEMKAKFNNDKNQFFASAGSNEWFDKLGLSTEEKKEEVKPVESES